MRFFRCFLVICILTVNYEICFGCTGILSKKGNAVLFGNNEDHGDPNSYVWFQISKPGKFGGVYYGFQDKYPQGGMNEKGLSFDHFARPYLKVTGSSSLPQAPTSPRNGEWVYQMLETCENVSEAIAFLRQFNLWFFCNFQLFLADRFGNSAIVEGDSIIHKDGDFQVVTNFLQSHPELGNYPCWRYDKATQMLGSCDSITIDCFRSILAAVHTNNTCYSNIHDPENATIYLYYMHQFERVAKIDVREELAKGDRVIEMPSLFQGTHVLPNYDVAEKYSIILYPNYPNPFNPSTTIRYELPRASHVTLKVFNTLGQQAATLVDAEEQPGYKSVQWDASSLASGVYIYRLTAGDYVSTKKMLVLR